jgi:hypothetical protein
MRVPRPSEADEVAMSDRGNEPIDRPDLPAGLTGADGRSPGRPGDTDGRTAGSRDFADEETAFRALVGIDDIVGEDLFDELEPSDIDDVAFGLDVNPDDVDLTFDPNWHSSVSDRGWGESSWGE